MLRGFIGCLLYKILGIISLNISNGGQCSNLPSDKMINLTYLSLIFRILPTGQWSAQFTEHVTNQYEGGV